MARDLRIDFLRGLFILSLCGSHFAWMGNYSGFPALFEFRDMQGFGFSSPAECFVFFSGYVMALVVKRDLSSGLVLSQARVLHRAWQLYVLNAFAFLIVVALSPGLFNGMPPILYSVTRLDRMFADPLGFIGRFLTFRDYIVFFEILRNYIFFIPLTPLFVLVWQRSVSLAVGLSGGVWLLHQFGMTPAGPFPTFNPYGWQLVYFGGSAVALTWPMTEWRFPRRGLQIGVCVALLALAFAAKQTFFHGVAAGSLPGANKTDVGPVRLLHFALVLWTAMLLVPASVPLERYRIPRWIVRVGQNSLECFCTANVLEFVCGHLMGYAPTSILYHWTLLLALMGAMCFVGWMVGWIKTKPWAIRRPPRAETAPIKASVQPGSVTAGV